jgi:hypothetical protein
MGRQVALVEPGYALLLVAAGQRDQTAEVGISLGGLYQERQVGIVLRPRSAKRHLATEEGLDADPPRGLDETHGSIEGIVVGQRQGGDVQVSGSGCQGLRGGDAVEEAVAGVGVKLGVARDGVPPT